MEALDDAYAGTVAELPAHVEKSRPTSRRAALEKPRRSSKLDWPQCGRAGTALPVASHHASGATRISGHDVLGETVYFGNAGVDLFFLISGFIIINAHWRDFGHPRALTQYADRRSTHIYALHWALCLFVLPSSFCVASAGDRWQCNFENVADTLLLLPLPPKLCMGAAWNLVPEIGLYAAFALTVANKHKLLLPLDPCLISSTCRRESWFENDDVTATLFSCRYTALGTGLLIPADQPPLSSRFGVY